jgi:hypothetical protein
MNFINRNPEKYDSIDLWDHFLQTSEFGMEDAGSIQESTRRFSDAILANQTDGRLRYGKHIEKMFLYVAAALGKCKLIKKEDAGEIVSDNLNISPPDYLCVFADDSKVLVEVKNCHKVGINDAFEMRAVDYNKLLDYANLFGTPLYFSVFWSKWRKWTLLRAEDLARKGKKVSISFRLAAIRNCLSIFGDMTLATTPPIEMRFLSDPTKQRRVAGDGKVQFTIGEVKMFCGTKEVTDRKEQSIAFYFLRFSNWKVEESQDEIVDRNMISFSVTSAPEYPVEKQEFQILGNLSDMIGNHYMTYTVKDEKLVKLTPGVGPEKLLVRIPEGYSGKSLPLWRFTMMANYEYEPS